MSTCEICRARFADSVAMKAHRTRADFGMHRCLAWWELRAAGFTFAPGAGWVAPARYVAGKVSA
jgi:hypothetical protein